MLKQTMVAMRDGVRLFTWCLIPDEPGQYPIAFFRTPYDEKRPVPSEREEALHRAGYAVVHQCCRGTSRSEGVHVPFQGEREDGLDTLAWIREQSFYRGEVYVFGESYNSFVHLAYLDTCPEDIKGAMLWVMPTNMYRGLTLNGVWKQDVLFPWYILEYHKNERDTPALLENYPAILRKRPLCRMFDSLYPAGCPEFEQMVLAGEEEHPWSGYGSAGDALEGLKKLKVPILLMEGWYNFYIGQVESLWAQLPEETRSRSALLIGPWDHSCQVDESWDISLPYASAPADLMVNWFDHLRLGTKLRFVREGHLTYYTLGSGSWEQAGQFPKTVPQAWFLNGGGVLSQESDKTEWRTWRYDPAVPTHFNGGANGFGSVKSGVREDREPDSGEDLVSFVSDPLEQELRIIGRIGIELTVRSDCRDTAFFVRVDVQKGGKFLPVQESIIALSTLYPDYTPGEEARITISTEPTSWLFSRGDRLRVDVASANWPVYPAHGNVAGNMVSATDQRVAHNAVKTACSRILLPVSAAANQGETL